MYHSILFGVQGLDPASRRNLWDVVKNAKRNRGIILTTHSMEEAEVRLPLHLQMRAVILHVSFPPFPPVPLHTHTHASGSLLSQ